MPTKKDSKTKLPEGAPGSEPHKATKDETEAAKSAVVDNATREIVRGEAASGIQRSPADENEAHDPKIAGTWPGKEAIGNTNPAVTTGDGSTDTEGRPVDGPDTPDDSSAKTHGIGG